VVDYRVGVQFGIFRQYVSVEVAFPLHCHLISCLRNLFKSLHSLFVSLGQRPSGRRTDVTDMQAGVTVPETAAKFVHVPGLYTESVHTEVRNVWQSVLSTVSTVQYLASVRLFPIQ
jgi:hypothetical protein